MKKLFLIMLAACSLSVMAQEAEPIAQIQVGEGTPIKFTTFESLQDYISETLPNNTEATVTLLQNIELGDVEHGQEVAQTFYVPANKNIILNLNGKGIVEHWSLYNTNKSCTSTYEWTEAGLTSFWHNWVTDLASADENEIMNMLDAGFIKENKVCDEDIYVNALIYNRGTLRIISEGSSIVQMNLESKAEDGAESANTICNDGILTIDGGIFIGPNSGFDLPKCPVIWAYSDNSDITINGGTFLCYEGTSDYNKGADWGPITGPGTWHIQGGIFSTDEMVGTPIESTGNKTSHRSTKDYWFTGNKALDTDHYTAIDVPYSNARIQGYNIESRYKAYCSYVDESEEHINEDVNKEPGEENYTKIIYNGICPDSAKMALQAYYYNADKNQAPGGKQHVITEDSAMHKIYYQRYRYAIKPVCVVVPTGTTAADFLLVQPNETITVADGATLHKSSIVMGDGNSKIIVEAGGTLLSDGDIVTSTPANIELTMDARANKYSTLAVKANNIQAKHPDATVTLKSVCNFDGSYSWQRFAIPTYLENQTVASFVKDEATAGFRTAVYTWDYAANDWGKVSGETTLYPFIGYNMTIDRAATADYTFKCELVGNGNPSVYLHHRWNFLANSYTAPMSLAAILQDLIGKESGEDAAAVWVQDAPGSDDWTSCTFADVFFGDLSVTRINPMQAFLVQRLANDGSIELDYENYVWKANFVGGASAPARRAPKAYEDVTRANIIIEAENGKKETVKLYLSDDFSEAYDNGFDLEKYMNNDKFNLYAVTNLGNMERVASNDLENLSITLQTRDASSYTLKFESVTLEGYAVLDNVTSTKTEIKDGNEYVFEAAANATHEGRFTIVKIQGGETAIENTAAGQNVANGIYTLEGQYVGNNLNVLPAGVYVINGQKVVK